MRSLLLLPFLWLALGPGAVHGQSLSLARIGETAFGLEALAPASDPQVLQASANLHLWIDLQEDIRGRYTYDFPNAGSARRFFRLTHFTEPAPEIRVMLIGDSTASDICGWGQGIYGFFKSNATVVNYAYPWTSTRVFLHSAEMEKMVLVKPDYVLMQFGYVDANSLDTTQTTTVEQYGENLKTIAQTIRGWNGTPILLTLHAPRAWDEHGKVMRTWADRSVMVRKVAAELGTPLIDLHELTFDLYTKLGPAGSKFTESECFPDETMHFSLKGGQVISGLVVNALPDILGPYLTPELFNPQPKP